MWEWNEAVIISSFRGLRGGYWEISSGFLAASSRGDDVPLNEGEDIGFRIASAIPEPTSLLCCGVLALVVSCWKWLAS